MGLYKRRPSGSPPVRRDRSTDDRALERLQELLQETDGAGWVLARSAIADPFYLRSGNTPMAHHLPKVKEMLEGLKEEEVTCHQRWDKDLGVSGNCRNILAALGDLLEPSATIDTSGGGTSRSINTFDRPLLYRRRFEATKLDLKATFSRVEERDACMYFSAAKLADGPSGIHQVAPEGYVLVTLGSRNGTPITEYAHRFVLWSMHGPDVAALEAAGGWSTCGPHCLHTCGNKDCVNSRHLVWGTAQDNKTDLPFVYLALLEKQGRLA